MKKESIFSNKTFLIVLSVIIAFVSWVVVSLDSNDTKGRTISGLSIDMDQVDDTISELGLSIISSDDTRVAVRVEGVTYAIGNLEACLTGTNLGGENYQYLGNLNAGTEGSVDFDITPDAAGNISGVITLNYEDASGNPRTISKNFTATAEEMNYDDYMPDSDSNMDEPQQTGMPVWGWVLIVVCVGVVVAVIVVVVLRKRKKAKALAALDEDSDEDI